MVRGEEALDVIRMYQDGVSISEIARRTGYDRKTIRRILREGPVRERPRPQRSSKLDPYKPYVLARMEAGVLNAVRIHRELQSMGFDGGLTILRDFMRPHRPARSTRATPRFETPPGQQAQIDIFVFPYRAADGQQRRLYYFALVLGYSRFAYGEFLKEYNKLSVLQALRRALVYIGGAPAEILSDNASVLVRRREGNRVEWQPEYLDMAAYFGFTPRACRPYRARTKGKNERFGRYVRQAFWPRTFTDLQDLNRQHWHWLETEANVRIHGTTHERPADRWQREQAYLKPLPTQPLVLVRTEPRQVAWDGTFSWNQSRYSVPWEWAARTVLVREQETGELVVEADGQVIACHQVAGKPHSLCIDPAHHAGMPLNTPCCLHHPLGIQVAPEVEQRPLRVYELVTGVSNDE
ncbi:MAG TPA: IS21 family transposase [Symbiobacteriaceae bacterium]